MRFRTLGKACLVDLRVRWWSLLPDWPTVAEGVTRIATQDSACEPLL